jgi:hypothetical protein
MNLFDIGPLGITPEWVQAGELGLAFVVVLLCSGLVLYVMKTSARREHELLQVIMKVLPVMESMSTSMTNINLRLESIEDNMGIKVKAPRKRSETVPRKVTKEVVDGA